MVSNLISRRNKKATVIVSKQTLEQALQDAEAVVDELLAHDDLQPGSTLLNRVEEAVDFLTGILSKSPAEMQAEGASTLDDYLDDAINPEVATKVKQHIDFISKMKKGEGDRMGNLPSDSTVGLNTRANEWDKQTLNNRPKPSIASWVSDRGEDGQPKPTEKLEVPRLATAEKTERRAFMRMQYQRGCPECKNEDTYETTASIDGRDKVKVSMCDECGHTEEKYEIMFKPESKKNAAGQVGVPSPQLAAPVAPKPVPARKPSADIKQLDSDTLAKVQKALATADDLMNDKAAQAFIAAIAEELMNRPVETEAPEAAELPKAAAFGGLVLAGFGDEPDPDDCVVCNHPYSKHDSDGHCSKCGEHCYDPDDVDNSLDRDASDEGSFTEDEVVFSSPECPQCGGEGTPLGMLGRLIHYRCRQCGWDFSEKVASGKKANNQGGSWFVSNGDTGTLKEDGGRTPEIAEAHAKQDDKTGITRPATELPSKFAGEITTNKAVKLVERLGNDLKALYLESKPITQVLDSRPVREAVESIYRAYDQMGQAAKELNKLNMQEENEAKASEIKEKGKKSSALFGLTLAAAEEEDGGRTRIGNTPTCEGCGESDDNCSCDDSKCEGCKKSHTHAHSGYASEYCKACCPDCKPKGNGDKKFPKG